MSSDGLHGTVIEKLRHGLAGEVIVPANPGYAEACSIFNAVIDRRPALITQCENAEDVATAIRFGQDHDLEIAVRGGGHSVAGMALTDGGIVIESWPMSAPSIPCRSLRWFAWSSVRDVGEAHSISRGRPVGTARCRVLSDGGAPTRGPSRRPGAEHLPRHLVRTPGP